MLPIVKRKRGRPPKPRPMTLDQAKAALADTRERITTLELQRTTLLLGCDEGALDKAEVELSGLLRYAARLEDRIGALRAQAEEAAADAATRARQKAIAQIEKRLAERDKIGADLQDTIARADQLFRQLVTIGREAGAAWHWPVSDKPACMLTPGGVRIALEHEIFRVGSRPRLLGGMDHGRLDTGLDYPGGRSPRLELTQQPEKIPPFVDVLKQATAHARKILHSGVGDPIELPGVAAASTVPAALVTGEPAPHAAANGAAPPAAVSSVMNGVPDPQQSPSPVPAPNGSAEDLSTKARLAQMLLRQNELASLSSPTPEQDIEYTHTVAAVAQLADELAAEGGLSNE